MHVRTPPVAPLFGAALPARVGRTPLGTMAGPMPVSINESGGSGGDAVPTP